MNVLTLENVSFTYPNGFEAVQNVSADFQLGESVAIIGQNGAGKTTTVKLMNGLLRPTKGRVLIDEKDTHTHTTAQMAKHVGYVFKIQTIKFFKRALKRKSPSVRKSKNYLPLLLKSGWRKQPSYAA